MKIIEKMVLSEVAGEIVAVPSGKAAEVFHGIIRLNETSRDIWIGIEEGKSADEIAADLVEKYDGVDLENAERSVLRLIGQIEEAGLFETK